MKRSCHAIFFSFLLASSSHTLSKDKFFIGYNAEAWNYAEESRGAKLMNESGLLHGVKISYLYHPWESTYFINPSFSYSGGNSDYDGENWNGEKISNNDRKVMMDLDFKIGKNFHWNSNFITSFGLANYFRHFIHPKNKNAGSYRRENRYHSAGVFLSSTYIFSGGRFSLTPRARFDHLISGLAKPYFGKANPDFPNLKLKQKEGQGLYFSLKANYEFNKYSVSLEPYFRQWRIKQSEMSDAYTIFNPDIGMDETMQFVEPANETESYGLNLSLGF